MLINIPLHNRYWQKMSSSDLRYKGSLLCRLLKGKDLVKHMAVRISLRSGNPDIEGAYKLAQRAYGM